MKLELFNAQMQTLGYTNINWKHDTYMGRVITAYLETTPVTFMQGNVHTSPMDDELIADDALRFFDRFINIAIPNAITPAYTTPNGRNTTLYRGHSPDDVAPELPTLGIAWKKLR